MNHQLSASLTVATSSRWGGAVALGLVAKVTVDAGEKYQRGNNLKRSEYEGVVVLIYDCWSVWGGVVALGCGLGHSEGMLLILGRVSFTE